MLGPLTIAKPWIAALEVGPHVGAAAAARLTHELWLDIRLPHLIVPPALR